MSQPKSFYLDGKRYRLSPKVPAQLIRWLVMHLHVGDTDERIAESIRERCTGPGWNPMLTEQAVRYALRCHRVNQRLVRLARL